MRLVTYPATQVGSYTGSPGSRVCAHKKHGWHRGWESKVWAVLHRWDHYKVAHRDRWNWRLHPHRCLDLDMGWRHTRWCSPDISYLRMGVKDSCQNVATGKSSEIPKNLQGNITPFSEVENKIREDSLFFLVEQCVIKSLFVVIILIHILS